MAVRSRDIARLTLQMEFGRKAAVGTLKISRLLYDYSGILGITRQSSSRDCGYNL